MIFHSLDYVIFFLAVFVAYWLLSLRGQNVLLLGASYFFYGYVHPWFLIPIIATTCVDYVCGIRIERSDGGFRRFWLIVSLLFSLGTLFFFKYHNFFVENVQEILERFGYQGFGWTIRVILPVGISFYTFQSIGYVVDIYRRNLPACRNLLDYAVFVSFFPQLVAGPIERSGHLLPQLRQKRKFDAVAARGALVLMTWGFFKKLVIADNVAVVANKIFALQNPDFPLLWVGVFAFCIQIYADFSAYTDIARGSARLLGVDLMENFRHPYLSATPNEFWGRWHISLSTWIRDYIYVPLGGSRSTGGRNACNLLVAFFLSGLWHGAAWNFILWGLFWGFLILLYRTVAMRKRPSGWRVVPAVIVLFLLTNVGWLIFRESNLHYLGKCLMLTPFGVTADEWQVAGALFLLTLSYSVPIWLHAAWDTIGSRLRRLIDQCELGKIGVQVSVTSVLFLGILVFRSYTQSDFIYFQF
jgi:alginate O-acetyltransferase complex protein AlgI